MKFIKLPTFLLLTILVACKMETSSTKDKNISDSVNHGDNELADSDNNKIFTSSDYNSDNLETTNIARPNKSSIKTQLDTTLLFGVWTNDPQGPHADFELTRKSFYVVDYDGDGDMPYELTDSKLKIYYNDFIKEGNIVSVDKDALKIKWTDNEQETKYFRWTE